ncbi:MAG: hypothetical protein WBB07_23800 [Mycobacterium sp.]
MPADDLLRFVGEPPAYSVWWLVLGVAGIIVVLGWVAAVYVWTLPPERLRGRLHTWLTRRRFLAAVRRIGDEFRSGALTAEQASAGLSRAVRGFLSITTGTRAHYLHVSEISDSPDAGVSAAAPLLAALAQAQFDPNRQPDLAALEQAAGELISGFQMEAETEAGNETRPSWN